MKNALGSLALPLPPFGISSNPHTLKGVFKAKGGIGGSGFGLSPNPKGACPMLQRLDLPAGYALKVLPASGQPCGLQANLQPINQK